ncbi:MAG TPA: hypothetical protein VKA09_04380 [Nitrososphaeraceae archaeon]|nr:hypothetical protein [Nitrososphaeraceae archaeon]
MTLRLLVDSSIAAITKIGISLNETRPSITAGKEMIGDKAAEDTSIPISKEYLSLSIEHHYR